MSTIQQSNHDIHLKTQQFFKLVHLPGALRQSNAQKHKGVQIPALFQFMILTIFQRFSLHRAEADPSFSKRTVRNCLNDARINWQRLVLLVAFRLINYVRQFIDKRRDQALIIDDSLFKREFSKKTELLSKVFDHDKQKYYTGFRALTLGWSDGNTFLPLNFALMTSSKIKNHVGPQKQCDGRSLAAKRRQQAHRKMNLVALELVDDALKTGIRARYALFDSWFAYPRMFQELLKRGINGIGMIKQTQKAYFRYRGREMSVKALYTKLKKSKWPQHQNYLYSPIVQYDLDGVTMPMKLVFVTKKGAKGRYLVLATTQTNLRPERIIQLYGWRWQIEGYFKIAKQYLRFDATQVRSYDGLCAHMAMVMLSYDLLALCQREEADERTLGDLFFYYGQSLPDIAVVQALNWLMSQLIGIAEAYQEAQVIIDQLMDEFMRKLPGSIAELIGYAA